MRKKIILALVFVLLICSLLAIGYPLFYSWYSRQHNSRLFTDYANHVDKANEAQLLDALDAARRYNQGLAEGLFSPLQYKENGYYELLDLTKNGVMGFLEIPGIHVLLPIRHGTAADTLSGSVGHMEQTSLPIGGAGTHAVLSAHTGTARQPLFTDLVLLQPGDLFYITVLDQRLIYQVDQITTVLPQQLEQIRIDPQADYVTLLTCTPYGVNTHRLLVRGCRIDPVETEAPATVPTEPAPESSGEQSLWGQQYLFSILIGIGIALFLLLLAGLILHLRRHKKI